MGRPAIALHNGYEKDSYTYYPVIIVGAGESGIALGCRLKSELGFDQFRIYDRQAGIGGTWWINRYPGVACDVPAPFYSFSFSPNPRWTSCYPAGSEIVQYMDDVCKKYQIVDKIQLNTDVNEARWLEDEEEWEVTLTHMRPGAGDLSEHDRRNMVKQHGAEYVHLRREVVRAKILASAVGGLVEPKSWPINFPGRDAFEGSIFHSARWDASVDLTNKNVVVVGTGCSAAQMVPRLTQAPHNARSVTQLMRSPPWVVPRQAPPFGHENFQKWAPTVLSYVPGMMQLLRFLMFLGAESDWKLFGGTEYHAQARAKVEAASLELMKTTVPEKYHEILTPDYGIGCKRRIFDSTWYAALNDPKIELTTLLLTSIQPGGVTLGPGRSYPDARKTDSSAPTHQVQHPADVIILANGFEVGEWLHPLKVQGKGGRLLHEVWEDRGGAQAYLGTAMDGFPNMFLIFGPNTATGHSSVILASENMANYSLNFIKPILDGDVSQVDIKREVEIEWARDIQAQLKKTVWESGGCHSWYKQANGWNSTVYPYSQWKFLYLCTFPKWNDWNIKYTEKGLFKQRIRRGLTYVTFALAIIGISRARTAGYGLRDSPQLLRTLLGVVLNKSLETGVRGLELLRGKL